MTGSKSIPGPRNGDLDQDSATPPRWSRYELPACFIERFRPVKAQPREKGLPAYLFDAYALEFYRQLSTAGMVSAEAIWSVCRLPGGWTLTHGLAGDAAGYIVAQRLLASDDATLYPLPVRLCYRARVAVQALRQLRSELMRAASADIAEAVALIDRRIDAYHHPAV